MTGPATSVALTGTRSFPVFRRFPQPGFDKVSFDVTNDFLVLIAVSDPGVKIVLRPEGSGTLQDAVRLECRSALDPRDLSRKGIFRLQQQMDVV